LEIAGSFISNGSASSLTVASPTARRARIARRVGLASAANAAHIVLMSCGRTCFEHALSASGLCWRCTDVFDRALGPSFERAVADDPVGCDVDHRAHGTAAEVHRTNVQAIERGVSAGLAESEHQVASEDAARHVAADE
jgi:hypothetical protein